MTIFVLQSLVLICAGVLLYKLVSVASDGWWTWRIVAAGFCVRALAGVALFWVSWAELPVARALQRGDGLWFFALDAEIYMSLATRYATDGWGSILLIDRTVPSPFYVQILAAGAALVGAVASTGLLLNLFAYAGTCALIVKLGKARDAISSPRNLVLAALACSPAGVLWSSQPLKDTLFAFLIVAWATGVVWWQRSWSDTSANAPLSRIGAGALMVSSVYAIAGVRWYFAIIALAAVGVAMIFTLPIDRRSSVRFAAAVVMVLATSQTIVLAARPYLPNAIIQVLRPGSVVETVALAEIATTVKNSRDGFERSAGATSVRLGRRLSSLSSPPAPAEPSSALSTAPAGAVAAAALTPVAPQPNPEPADLKVPEGPTDVPPSGAPVAPSATEVHAARGASGDRVVPTSAPPQAPMSDAKQVPVAVAPVVVSSAPVDTPPTHLQKFLAGAVATVVPRSIAQATGLVEVGGGKGLWLFVELDTLAFDAALIFSLLFFGRAFLNGGWRNPAMWQVAIVFVLASCALMYTVSNFGTLFRHRGMIYTALLMLPVIASFVNDRRGADAADESASSAVS